MHIWKSAWLPAAASRDPEALSIAMTAALCPGCQVWRSGDTCLGALSSSRPLRMLRGSLDCHSHTITGSGSYTEIVWGFVLQAWLCTFVGLPRCMQLAQLPWRVSKTRCNCWGHFLLFGIYLWQSLMQKSLHRGFQPSITLGQGLDRNSITPAKLCKELQQLQWPDVALCQSACSIQ